MSMNREPQRDEAPSFDLGIDPPLLTTQDLSDIEELDELVKKAQDQFQTPQTKKSLENQKDLEEKVVTWATVPKGGNEFETIFKLAEDRFLEVMRLGCSRSMVKARWTLRRTDHMTLPPWDFFVLDSKNIVSPSDERSTMNHFAVIQHLGSNANLGSLLPRYVNIPGQPNETDCGIFVMKWMELIDPTGLAASCEANKGYNIDKWGEPKLDEFRKQIVAKILLSKDNEKRMETIRLLNKMRNIRPAAVFRSPYV
ncbi:hypothetical protein PIB30_059869 [Stylosanthes scabra]|uniref:Ubiquitin-like protease family profile domain-containing protein n=1 Tax=Stylosanthes scabra TaxID=79078 RepID=A0ABU6TM07_9FABA|nr:hypothetical protein [Stylosanthes scabra]